MRYLGLFEVDWFSYFEIRNRKPSVWLSVNLRKKNK